MRPQAWRWLRAGAGLDYVRKYGLEENRRHLELELAGKFYALAAAAALRRHATRVCDMHEGDGNVAHRRASCLHAARRELGASRARSACSTPTARSRSATPPSTASCSSGRTPGCRAAAADACDRANMRCGLMHGRGVSRSQLRGEPGADAQPAGRSRHAHQQVQACHALWRAGSDVHAHGRYGHARRARLHDESLTVWLLEGVQRDYAYAARLLRATILQPPSGTYVWALRTEYSEPTQKFYCCGFILVWVCGGRCANHCGAPGRRQWCAVRRTAAWMRNHRDS